MDKNKNSKQLINSPIQVQSEPKKKNCAKQGKNSMRKSMANSQS